ncbi:MAG: hypothetical protein H6819_08490 [Phycisphaerales bacterium]|nr:hypothetical protein [Phycisphaerales bacterium]MCB9854156.1 hypothetical protein [Phycisphaerales bacterium]MCB9864708.1 hypothetical protein [Phycisphaerales bacterium]
MTHRIWGISITIAWFVMLGLLIRRDVMPFWLAQEPPADSVPDGNFQTAILKEGGRRIGTSWVTTVNLAETKTVHGMTILDVSGIVPLMKTIRLESTLSYNEDDALDEFAFVLDTEGASARVTGERYSTEFACIAELGAIKRQISLDAGLTAYLSDTLRPFTLLKGLHVGQAWRMRVIDPFALLQSQEARFDVRLVRVTRKEKIKHRGTQIECFRVETEQTVAWADDDGRVLRQEVSMPFLGKWIMLDEPYDGRARQDAKRSAVESRANNNNNNNDLRESAARLIEAAHNAAPDVETFFGQPTLTPGKKAH